MQMQLPIFPVTTKMLSSTWGVFEKDNFVYYLHNGSPVHVHEKDDLNTYRFITATLIENHSCSASSLSKVFGVNVILKDMPNVFVKVGRKPFLSPMINEANVIR